MKMLSLQTAWDAMNLLPCTNCLKHNNYEFMIDATAKPDGRPCSGHSDCTSFQCFNEAYHAVCFNPGSWMDTAGKVKKKNSSHYYSAYRLPQCKTDNQKMKEKWQEMNGSIYRYSPGIPGRTVFRLFIRRSLT